MIRYLTPVRPDAAHGLVGDVYRQIKHDFGALVDPFVVHSVSPRLLAAVWGACRESQLVGVVPREIKEAVAVTVSKFNRCPFCIDAHVVMLHAVKAHSIARALSDDRLDRLSDQTRDTFAWANSAGRADGLCPTIPFAAEEAPEVIGTAVFYHYMNRICTVLLDDTPLPSNRRWLKGPLSRTAGWYFSFAARRPKVPGAALAFLPDADLPNDLAWAASSATLAGAWARCAREVERQGQAVLPADTRELAADLIRQWDGEALGIDRSSLEDSVQRLSPDERSSARLVLLSALAPHQVDEPVIRAFADPAKEPEKLLGALSWASFTAARRIGTRLSASPCSPALSAHRAPAC